MTGLGNLTDISAIGSFDSSHYFEPYTSVYIGANVNYPAAVSMVTLCSKWASVKIFDAAHSS